jgi:hypothetical protein
MTNIKPENKFNAPLGLDAQLFELFDGLHNRIYKLELAVNELTGQARPPAGSAVPPAPPR